MKKKKVKCQILDIQLIPGTSAHIVSVEFSIGKRAWNQGFRVDYDRPISMEEFKRDLAERAKIPVEPEDFLIYVKEEAAKPFTIELPSLDKE